MEDKNSQNKNETKEPKSRFKSGSMFDRWESDGEDFISFHSDDTEKDEKKETNK